MDVQVGGAFGVLQRVVNPAVGGAGVNIARFVDFVGESITRAAEQAREILYTKAETTAGGTATPSSDRG